MKKILLKFISGLVVSVVSITQIFSSDMYIFANGNYDYTNPIYSNGIDDTFVYDSTDSVVITKKNVARKLPNVTGRYDISSYPIPLTNKVPSKDVFELIKKENKEIMDNVEKDIQNGTLTKHKAADGQFYGTVPDSALGVEKKIYINTNAKGLHSLASYVPAGEIATVKLNDEALRYAKKGKIKISVGMTMVDAEDYNYNNNIENRMPYLGKTFSISQSETKVGTPFGGMVYIDIDDSVPSGLKLEVDVKGVVDTPYFDLGKTTEEEWKIAKDAPGVFAEIRTPYLRFAVPAKFIREIENPHDAALFWTNVTSISAEVMAQQYRNRPMTLTFDQYITAGIAYASVGAWTCNLPPDWGTDALNYDTLMKSGGWGIIHEINHHYQGRYSGYSDEWGVGNEFSEITNNAISAVAYILYTNIAEYRGEEGTYDWNKVADPYSSLKQQIYEGDQYYVNEPNIGNFMYSTFAHEIGPVNFANVIKSTYDGGTFNGIYIPPYDYKLESDGKKSRTDRFDDLAYRLSVAGGRDYTWYMENELLWPLKSETINKIKKLGYEEVIPVQSVYATGEVGRETGRAFYVTSTGYVFDFDKSLVSPGNVSVVDVSKPKYGTLSKRPDGKYDYKPSPSMPENAKDEFILTVEVEKDGIRHETKLNCVIGVDYNSSNVEKFATTKWDIHDALKDLETMKPYATSSSIGMRINTDDGNNAARSKGYFVLEEGGEYEFQVFGDDNTAFTLHLEDGTTLQSLTEDYSANVNDAYNLPKSTKFTVNLEANKAYPYTLVANNKDGIGWADVNIRKTSGDTSWKSINQVYSNLNDVGKYTDRSFTMPEPAYVRPPVLAGGNETLVNDIKVISTPKGVTPNDDPNSLKEGDPNNIVDGDLDSYFHSSYSSDKTPLPHEYIFDLGGEKSFNNIEVYTRRTGDEVGVIGDYEVYVADKYDASNTNWTKIAEDHTRNNNSNASKDLKISVPQTKANYLKIKALNNRSNEYDLTILAELKLSTETNVKKLIAQNSSFIQYKGNWTKDSSGAFVNGATYNTTDGYFMYCFDGKESNIYSTKDVEVEMRVNGGKWKKAKLIGSLREPSITLDMGKEGKYVVEVRGIGQEIALNMISTDGTFYKGNAPTSKSPVIIGADDIEIGVGQVDTFDEMDGVSYTDDIDTTGLTINVSGNIGKPKPGTNEKYTLTYSVTDSDSNTTTVDRVVTVTNQLPQILGLDEVTIRKGTKFDLKNKVIATDYEDKNITDKIVYPSVDVSTLDIGVHNLKYSVEDSDKNITESTRTINILSNESPVIIGADNIEIGVGQVDTFDKMDGISYTDDIDKTGLTINVSGNIGKPKPGTNEKYTLTYSVTDSDSNTTTVDRIVTVTNQLPQISKLENIVIKKGQSIDLLQGVIATDKEDGDITKNIEVIGTVDTNKEGTYNIEYKVEDSDKNIIKLSRIVVVEKIDEVIPPDEEENSLIHPVIEEAINNNLVRFISGTGRIEDPLELEINNISDDKADNLLSDLKALDIRIDSLEDKYGYTVVKFAISTEGNEENNITLKVKNDYRNIADKLKEFSGKTNDVVEDDNISNNKDNNINNDNSNNNNTNTNTNNINNDNNNDENINSTINNGKENNTINGANNKVDKDINDDTIDDNISNDLDNNTVKKDNIDSNSDNNDSIKFDNNKPIKDNLKTEDKFIISYIGIGLVLLFLLLRTIKKK